MFLFQFGHFFDCHSLIHNDTYSNIHSLDAAIATLPFNLQKFIPFEKEEFNIHFNKNRQSSKYIIFMIICLSIGRLEELSFLAHFGIDHQNNNRQNFQQNILLDRLNSNLFQETVDLFLDSKFLRNHVITQFIKYVIIDGMSQFMKF